MNISQGPHYIDDTMTFTVTTHDPATGAVVDADAVPDYFIYENETGTAILSGSMAKLDDTNTTGFYSEQVTLSAANGFESGKTYSIYVEAAVDSVLGSISSSFRVSGVHPANVTQFGGSAGTFAGGRPEVNVTHAAGTAWNSGAIISTTFGANAITAAKLDPDVTTELQAGLATAAALATVDGIVDDILLDTAEIGAAGAGLTNINLPNQTMDIIGNITGNLSGSVGSVTGAVGSVTAGVTLANDAITAAKFDETTAWPLTAADTGATAVARTGADGDTLETLSDQIDDVPTNAELATSQAAADDATLAAIAALNNLSAAQVNTEVDTALADIHLDHLLAVTYDPASKPGAADALLNELVESDAGVARYTANALEQGPGGGSAPSAADIADAVWEEAIADHSGTVGSTAEALGAAGSAGDPWVTALPGAYGAGSAGKIIGDNVNATISSRATQTSVDDLPTNTELATSQAAADDATLAAIAALNNLSAAQVNAEVDTALSDYDGPTNAELATALGTADDAVLAQIALVKAKTDNLPTDPADQSAVEAAIDSAEAAILAAIPSTAAIEAAILDDASGIETSITPRQALRLILASSAGKLSGAATSTVIIRNVGDSKDRITATVDADGNRSAITVDAT